MALSNWLTRDEWNACYFAGLEESLARRVPMDNLSVRLRLGIVALHRSGYQFKGIKSTPEGDYEKVTQCCDGNASVLVELMQGTFDSISRAKETLIFAKTALPNLDFKWLQTIVDDIEKEKP